MRSAEADARAARQPTGILRRPGVFEPLEAGVDVGGDDGAVDRADRRADDEARPDVALEQCPQHADLARAEHAAASEDVRDLGAHGAILPQWRRLRREARTRISS
ncbi:hypothetical protein GCM10025877_32950 [Agromyces mangrovi Wang et al. 2018]|nr:hypothetical protein GCM10025877_32950 [Agromyces mangrovi]